MSTTSNVYSQGGGGTRYEFEIQSAFFINFLMGGDVPGFTNGRITEFRQQAGSLGYATDDLLLKCKDDTGEHLLLVQVKHNIVISENSDLFKDVLTEAWSDFKNPSLFDTTKDKIYLIKSALTIGEKNHLKQLLNWAKLKSKVADFNIEVFRIDAKKKYYDLFKGILDSIADPISDLEIFTFFKCFDLLEYDFDQIASTSRSNILTLLQLAKAKDEYRPEQIWNAVFTFISNSDSNGGFFTTNGLPPELSVYFKKDFFSENQKRIVNASKQSLEIIEFIDDTIGNINLDRKNILENAIERINNTPILILSGDAGTGKSAMAKSLLQNFRNNKDGYVLAFKADELNVANLRDVFLKFEIQLTVSEVLSHFPLLSQNIIYIDGFEKLLEGEGVAFKQLLKTIRNCPTVKLIISCRKANLNLIELKFFHDFAYEKLDIPLLSDEELNNIATKLPALKSVIENTRLLSLIRIPKYLDFAYKAIVQSGGDYSVINEVDFVNTLWDIIVENKINDNVDGLPGRRSKLFIDLAVNRSKTMQPFIAPAINDEPALLKLEKDNVIVQSGNTKLFAAAHDVLEDWALIRFVDARFRSGLNDLQFFTSLGTEPAMRRAYRLWVQNGLKEKNTSKIDFFTRNLSNSKLDRFWQDESLIAVLYSDYCETFLQQNSNLLQENEWSLLFRIVHVIRTACKENTTSSQNEKYFVPAGFGWSPLIRLFHKHIKEIPAQYFTLILNTIDDWTCILYNTDKVPAEANAAGLTVFYLLENHYLLQNTYYDEDKKIERCIKLIFNLCGSIKKEVTDFINKAGAGAIRKENDNNWKLVRYYEKVLDIVLSGLGSTEVAKHLPDLLIKLAKEKWYRKLRKPLKGIEEYLAQSTEGGIGDFNFHFGLVSEGRLSFFPASAYQTPVFWLLRYHPYKGIDFIIELINYTTEKYLASEFSNDDNCIDLELELSDGTKVKQHGSYVLWSMYRGTGKVTPYILQSVLMALERYLLEVAGMGDEFKDYLQKLILLLYKGSNSIATTSVIASVAQAYPLMAGVQLLPLLNGRSFITWDIVRYTHDFNPLAMYVDNKIYQDERIASNKLEHRLKYNPGLKGFFIHYCFNVRILNKQIFEKLDKLKSEAGADDMDWKRILEDMDIRQWKATKEYKEEGKFGFVVEPVYSEDVQVHVDQWKEPMEKSNKNAGYTLLLRRVQKKEETLTLEQWREIYLHYIGITEYKFLEHNPGLLAMIGIRDVWKELSIEERSWSADLIVTLVKSSIEKQHKPYDMSLSVSPYDDDAAMTIFPSVISLPDLDEEDREYVEKLFIQLLITHFQLRDPDYDLFLKAVNETFWEQSPEKAFQFFKGLVSFAEFTKSNPHFMDHRYSEEESNVYAAKYETFINDVFNNKLEWSPETIDYTKYSKWVLHKVIRIISDKSPTGECIRFLKIMIQLYLENEGKGKRAAEYDSMNHEIQMVLREKISNIIFNNPDSTGPELLEYFLDQMYKKEILSRLFKNDNELFNFFRETVKALIFITDNNLLDGNTVRHQCAIQNFAKIWSSFEVILSKYPAPIFADLLLLNIEWNKTAIDWLPINGMVLFFENAIRKYGRTHTSAVFNLLSHVGDKTLLPQGINWLVEIQKSKEVPEPILSFKYAELLMHRIYDNHLPALRANKELFDNYLWLLNEVITQGSSEAYWIREFLISFRQT